MGPQDLLIGRVIATKFAIESVIGSGAMGVVYKARHVALDKPVAVKVLHQAFANDEMFGARLRREAKAASRLDHPNSVRVIDFGEEPDGLLYIAMELLEGLDLFQTLERKWPIPDSRTIDLLCQTLSALAVAHDMGIVHRDLKPENIMLLTRIDDEGLPRDIVKVCDFGIAKTADASEDAHEPGARALTRQGVLIGTPEYMSPEQCRGQALDARSDLYSVGVILYQILTGRVPFQAASAIDVVLKHVSEEPEPPSAIRSNLSSKLEEVCLRALRKNPDERFSSAREMRAALRAAARAEGLAAMTPPPPSVGLVSKTAETLLSAVSVPVTEMAAPVGGDVPTQPSAQYDPSSKARARGRVRYAAMVAIPAVVIAAVAIGNRRGHAVETSPTLAVTSTPTDTARVEITAPPEIIRPPEPAPLQLTMRPSKTTVAPVARPRTVVRPTATGAVQAQTFADSEPEPRIAPPPPAIASAIPSAPSETKATLPAPLPPPPSAPPASPPGARIDPSRGRVVWNVSAASGGATAGNVARALGRASGTWQRCYQTELETRSGAVEGAATLRLTCDQQGRVVDVTFAGFEMGDMATCIRAASKGVTIPNADTGEAWASVALAFRVVE